MEAKILRRGALSGFLAGILGFAFARIFAEPYIQQAIDYESGRDAAINAVNKLLGLAADPDGAEIFSRGIQRNIGIATGVLVFSTAMGALIAVAYLTLHGRFNVRPRTLVLVLSGFTFLGVFMTPFVKYPANPPSIGHSFTIGTRSELYLVMVGCSVVFLALAAILGQRLVPKFGVFHASLIAAAVFAVAISIVMAVLPSLGHLALNQAQAGIVGFGKEASETPLPIRNPAGQIVYPGFPADVLWKFRFYAILAQVIIFSGIGLIFSHLVERVTGPVRPARANRVPVNV